MILTECAFERRQFYTGFKVDSGYSLIYRLYLDSVIVFQAIVYLAYNRVSSFVWRGAHNFNPPQNFLLTISIGAAEIYQFSKTPIPWKLSHMQIQCIRVFLLCFYCAVFQSLTHFPHL